MENDIRNSITAGVNGIVIGVLTPEGDIDKDAMRRLIEVARNTAREKGLEKLNITFHRAFDVSRDPVASLEDIIELGCDCLLTSGAAPSAIRVSRR